MKPMLHEQANINVRDLTLNDIALIANYWLNADKAYLHSMGVDVSKLPTREGLVNMLTQQINAPDTEKSSLALVAELDGVPIGHCNVNGITFGQEATMHLHLWNPNNRKKGIGTAMVLRSLPLFFNRLKLKTIWCEPYSLNPVPNRTLQKVGFEFVKKYVTVPGSLNFEQEVNRYKLTKDRLESIS